MGKPAFWLMTAGATIAAFCGYGNLFVPVDLSVRHFTKSPAVTGLRSGSTRRKSAVCGHRHLRHWLA